MLQWLRENLKSFTWTLWLVILAFVLGFALLPQFQQRGDDLGENHVARVDDLTIDTNEFARAYEQLSENYRRSFGERFTPELAKQLRLPQQVLEQLVNQKVQLLEAKRLGLKVSDAALRQAIFEIPGFKKDNGQFIGADQYANAVRRFAGFPSVPAFEGYVREQLLLGELRSVVAANLYVPDSAVEASYRHDVEKASIRFLELPASTFQSETVVSAEEAKSYFDTHKEDFRRPEQRVVTYLLVDNGKLRNSISISDAELSSYYGEHLSDYSQEEQVQARHILIKVDDNRDDAAALAAIQAIKKRLQAGADFAQVARESSEDPGSKDRGGDLGFFGRGRMLKEFEDAAFGAEVGQIVGPVRTSFGYHLMEVLEKRPAGQRPFEEVKNQIRFKLQNERAQQDSERRANELAARIQKEKLTSDDKLKELIAGADYLSLATTPPLGKQDPVPNIGRVPAFTDTAFSLAKGAVSDAVKVPRGWVIERLDDIREPRIPELAEVDSEVRAALTRKKTEEKVLARLEIAKRQLVDGKSLASLAAELGTEVKESGEFGHGQPITGLGASPNLVEAALSMSAGQVGGPIATRNGAVLFQVVDRKTWDPLEFQKTRADTRERLENEELQRVLGSLVEQRRRELRIEYSRSLLERFGIDTGNSPT